MPIVGDWNGNDTDTVGLFDPATGRFLLTDHLDATAARYDFTFGPSLVGGLPIAGDWNGPGPMLWPAADLQPTEATFQFGLTSTSVEAELGQSVSNSFAWLAEFEPAETAVWESDWSDPTETAVAEWPSTNTA